MQSRPAAGLSSRAPFNQTSVGRRRGYRRLLRKLGSVFHNAYFQAFLALLAALQFYQYFTTHENNVRHGARALSQKMGNHLPSFLGLWSIEKPQGQFSPLFPTSEEITAEAKQILPIVNELMEKKFFRIFKVDLDKECPFWARKDLCSSPAGSCSVCECSEEQIPLPWKEKPIEHFVDRKFYEKEEVSPWVRHTPFAGLPGPAGEAEDNFLASLSGTDHGGKSTYVDLSLNPPCFTAFKGQNVWSLIYKENCLSKVDNETPSLVQLNGEQQCSEEDFFVKMISGLQTAIMVLSSEYNKPLEMIWPLPFSAPSRTLKTKGAFDRPPPRHWYSLDLFRRRVAWNREWMENLYIDFSLLVRTVMKAKGVIEVCNCYTGTEIEDQQSRVDLEKLIHIISKLPSAHQTRLEQPLFQRKHELALRQFTNISRIMDCVECEKCRLHGKVKITALQVALKGAGPPSTSSDGLTPLILSSLERNEITALINTLGYFADAVLIIDRFERRVRAIRTLLVLMATLPLVFLGSYLVKRTSWLETIGFQRRNVYNTNKTAARVDDLSPLLCMLDETTSTAISSSNSATTTNGANDEFKATTINKKKRRKR